MISDHENGGTLNPPYNGMIEFLRSLNTELQLHILSTKAARYISEILDYSDIRLSAEQIHQAGRGLSKTDIVNILLQENQLSPGEVVFVDDHPDTVGKVSKTGVVCFLAGWGYNNVGQRRYISDKDIKVINLTELVEIFKYGNN